MDKIKYGVEVEDNATPKLKTVKASFDNVEKSTKSLSVGMVAVGNVIANFGTKAISSMVALGKETMQEADTFRKYGEAIGATASEVAGLDRAFNLAGATTEQMQMAINKLGVALDPTKITEQRNAVESLGVSVTKASGELKNQQELLFDIADAYKAETNATKKAAIGQRIFGEQASKLASALNQGGDALREQQKLYGDASGYSQEYAQNLESLNDAMYKAKIATMGLLTAIADSTIFKNAIQYVSNLTDEWVRFLSETKQKDDIKQTEKKVSALNAYSKELTKSFEQRLKLGRSEYNNSADLMSQAELNGARMIEIYAEQLSALNKAKNMALETAGTNEKAIAVVTARYEEQKNQIIANKDALLAMQKVEPPKEETKKPFVTPVVPKAVEAKAKEVDWDELAKKRKEANEKALYDSAQSEREYQEEQKLRIEKELEFQNTKREIAFELMSTEEQEREKVRLWYEEKRAIIGNDYDLQLLRDAKLADINATYRQEELDHYTKLKELEEQRLIAQDQYMQNVFADLKIITGEYKKLASIAQGVAYAEAIWNTYVGVSKAYAQGGVGGFITGALVLAKGIANANNIRRTKIDKFQNGGIVDGMQNYGDQKLVRVNSREMILNQNQQANLWELLAGKANNISKLQERSSGGSKNVYLTVNGVLDNAQIRKINRMTADALARA